MDTIVLCRLLAWAVAALAALPMVVNQTIASTIDYGTVYFQPGDPRKEDIERNVGYFFGKEQEEVLRGYLKALSMNPDMGGTVAGYTDELECAPSDCMELSVRRAKVVYDWLLSHGASPSQVRGPVGESTRFQIYRQGTSDERSANRRVQLEPFILPGDA